jgi:hypothetical protein
MPSQNPIDGWAQANQPTADIERLNGKRQNVIVETGI